MKKRDLILISVILGIALISFGTIKFFEKTGKEVVVTVDGHEKFRAGLSENKTYEVLRKKGHNIVEIKDGKVTMKEADCPDQICKNHKAIDKAGETIVCLPHKVVVEIKSDSEEEPLDGITK